MLKGAWAQRAEVKRRSMIEPRGPRVVRAPGCPPAGMPHDLSADSRAAHQNTQGVSETEGENPLEVTVPVLREFRD